VTHPADALEAVHVDVLLPADAVAFAVRRVYHYDTTGLRLPRNKAELEQAIICRANDLGLVEVPMMWRDDGPERLLRKLSAAVAAGQGPPTIPN